MTTPEMKPLLPPSTAFTPPFKIARGHEGYQLENGAGEMLCDGMRAQDASDLLGIVKAFFTRPTPQPSSEYEKAVEAKGLECCFPDEKDLDWLETAIQRHTGGMKEWWSDNALTMGFREMANAIIIQWEAGRLKASALAALKSHPTPSGWQGIESAPRGERVLLLWNDNIIGGIFEAHDEDGVNGPEVWSYWTSDGDLLIEDGPDSPTHWHPLLSPLSSTPNPQCVCAETGARNCPVHQGPTPAKEKP